jgi:hypothetical protein
MTVRIDRRSLVLGGSLGFGSIAATTALAGSHTLSVKRGRRVFAA